jgi:pimeloyl-ACP methyl ester carboxylesterase
MQALEYLAIVGLVGVTAITWVVGARHKPYCAEWLHALTIQAAQYAAKPLLRPTALRRMTAKRSNRVPTRERGNQKKIAMAFAAMAIVGIGTARADSFAEASISITNFKLLNSINNKALVNGVDVSVTAGLNSASGSGNINSSFAPLISCDSQITGITSGNCTSGTGQFGPGGAILFNSTSAGPDGVVQGAASPNPPVNLANPANGKTYSYGSHALNGAVIDLGGGPVGVTTTSLAQVDFGPKVNPVDGKAASNSTTSFDMVAASTLTAHVVMDYKTNFLSSVIYPYESSDTAFAGSSWTLTITDKGSNGLGNTLVALFQPGFLNTSVGTKAGDWPGALSISGTNVALINLLSGSADLSLIQDHQYNFSITSQRFAFSHRDATLSEFSITGLPAEIPVDSPFPITITAKDAAFNTITNFNGKVMLNASMGLVKPTSVDLVNGMATVSVSLDSVGTGIELFASSSGKTGSSDPFNVTGATAYGSVSGKVTDGRSKPLVGASVQFSQSGVNITAPFTNDKGMYQTDKLPPGVYTVQAQYNNHYGEVIKNMIIPPRSITLDLSITTSDCKNNTLTPILLVPGIMGSSTVVGNLYPVLSGKGKHSLSWNSYKWYTETLGLHDPYAPDPVLPRRVSGWMELIELLETKLGYKRGCNLFAVPYDWSLPINEIASDDPRPNIVSDYLTPAISYAKIKSNKSKVHIIAHSMGGLVARAYIQGSNYSEQLDIDKFLMVGTPNHGSAKVYLMWEGGDPKWADDLGETGLEEFVDFYSTTLNYLHKEITRDYLYTRIPSKYGYLYLGYDPSKNRKFIHAYLESAKQLMPTLPTLMDKTHTYEPVKEYNQWLNELNKGFSVDNKGKTPQGVQVRLFTGKDTDTITLIPVGKPNDLYTDGTPIGTPIIDSNGDGTVLENSAYLKGLPPNETATSDHAKFDHAKLIRIFKDQICRFINNDQACPAAAAQSTQPMAFAKAASVPSSSLNISIRGRLTPYLVDPELRAMGINPVNQTREDNIPEGTFALDGDAASLNLLNLAEGVYSLSLQGDRMEEYELSFAYSDADGPQQQRWDSFHHGGTETVLFSIAATGPGKLQVLRAPLPPANLQAWAYQSNGLKTRLTWDASASVVSYRVYTRRLDMPTFSFSGTATTPSYDTPDEWAVDGFKIKRLYAVTAIDGKGNESFMSVFATNDDRDHDNLADADEAAFGGNPDVADTDGDGLNDGAERIRGTSLTKPDTDGDGYSDAVEVQSGSDPLDKDSIPNQTPVANAGSNQNGYTGKLVTLNGIASYDPDSGPSPLTYAWTQTSGPTVALTGAGTATPSFTPTQSGTYLFRLVVSDGRASSAPASVTITVISPNIAPIANAGMDRTIIVGKTVTLNGSASMDPDNSPSPLTYDWRQTAGPAVTLINPTSTTPNFTPMQAGLYSFSLMVSDGQDFSLPATVTFLAQINYWLDLKAFEHGVIAVNAPSGTVCSGICRLSYVDVSTVTLTAMPDAGYFFAGWSGACHTANPICTVSINADTQMSATFYKPRKSAWKRAILH